MSLTTRLLVAAALLCPSPASSQLHELATGSSAEFRAMHAPDANTVWAAGRSGGYALSTDGGRTWRADSVPGAGGLFLTGVWAADSHTAHVLGTSFDGGLARIYRTEDGGRTWTMQWERAEEGVFMDALRCWDVNRCVAFGDPVGGGFMIVRTENGREWELVPRDAIPAPAPGEAGFAASGTALTTAAGGYAWIGTGGGPSARVYHSDDFGATWTVYDTPLAGGSTAGIFGIAFRDASNGAAVGGDYQQRTERQMNVLRTRDGGRTWRIVSASLPHGVRYGAAYSPITIDGHRPLLATGPSGVGVSFDDGASWIAIGAGVYNTLVFSPTGEAWVGGTEGRIARVEFPTPVTK